MDKYLENLHTLGQNIFDIADKDFEKANQGLELINGMLTDKNIRAKLPGVIQLAQTHKGDQSQFMGALMVEFMS
jgi:hypothetical protein